MHYERDRVRFPEGEKWKAVESWTTVVSRRDSKVVLKAKYDGPFGYAPEILLTSDNLIQKLWSIAEDGIGQVKKVGDISYKFSEV
jgi:hypothetical protein